MAKDCVSCVCAAAPPPGGAAATPPGSVLLATRVEHTVTALRTLARRAGASATLRSPGLLQVEGGDVEGFLLRARQELTGVEAAEVRCLTLAGPAAAGGAEELLAAAMTAPSLAAAGAQVDARDLLPLFDDEEACFHSVYQRIVGLADGATVGHEALLRARLPDGTPVMPDDLFPAAEAAGWTNLLDRVGRTTALRGAGRWLGDDLLFINFVPTSIYRPEVCLRTTEQAAARSGVRLDQIVFEVTEGHRVQDLDHLERVFAYYRSRDCKVALDDLGAGYSSLNTLVRLQPDVVKLDKDIVRTLPGAVAASVVEAIVTITHSYGGLVLAECVETPEQAAAAVSLGVDLGQGWLWGRPVRRDAEGAVVEPAEVPDRAAGHGRTGRAGRSQAVSTPLRAPVAAGVPAALLAHAVETASVGVTVVDVRAPDLPAVYVNATMCEMTGYLEDELVGTNLRLLQGRDTDRGAVRELARAVRDGREHRAVLRNYRKDGSAWWNELHLSPVRDARSVLTHYLGYQLDVTARVEAEQELVSRAGADGLTGIANRTRLFERLEQAVTDAAESGRAAAVVFLDLDGFKHVNDTFGHATGDAVLVRVAQRLKDVLRREDLLARNGGDEFVAVLSDLVPEEAEQVAHRVAGSFLGALAHPVEAGPVKVRLGASVGVAVCPHSAVSADRLLAEADAAMYRAKREGTGGIRTALTGR